MIPFIRIYFKALTTSNIITIAVNPVLTPTYCINTEMSHFYPINIQGHGCVCFESRVFSLDML